MITKQIVEKLANERIAERELDVYIVDINIGPAYQIVIELDSENGGVDITDCIAVSRNVEHNLDREEQDFSIEVASADISKPFKVLKQYIKNIGKSVELKPLTNDNYKSGKIEGILKSATEEQVVITTREKKRLEGRKKKEWVEEDHAFKMNEIKETKIIITF
jgi:ribosome maturation factor RimP